jgi:hypothetical protein
MSDVDARRPRREDPGAAYVTVGDGGPGLIADRMRHFAKLTRAEQAAAIRRLAADGMGDHTLAHATGLSVEMIRSVLGARPARALAALELVADVADERSACRSPTSASPTVTRRARTAVRNSTVPLGVARAPRDRPVLAAAEQPDVAYPTDYPERGAVASEQTRSKP